MANVRKLRLSRGMTYKELSERLDRLGRPIPVLGLSRLEKGERRIDVDDLVALAVALDVTPNTLLLPEVEFEVHPRYEMTEGGLQVRAEELWAWALGELPLGSRPASAESDDEAREAEGAFVARNRRHRAIGLASWMDAVLKGRTGGGKDHDHDAAMVAATVMQAFQWGRLDTADIRQAVESGFLSALLGPRDETDRIMQTAWRWLQEIYEQGLEEAQEGGES